MSEETSEKPKQKSTAKKKTASKKKPSAKKATSKKVQEKAEPRKKESSLQEKPKLQFETKPHHERGGSKGIFLALTVAIIIVIIAGGWYQTQQLNKSNQNATVNLDQKIETEVGELKSKLQSLTEELENQKQSEQNPEAELYTYENLETGVSFQYPAELGSATSDVNDNILRVSFSANPDIWINFASQDYTGSELFIYTGEEVLLEEACPAPLEVTEAGYCDTKVVANLQVVESTIKVGETDLLNIVKTINLPIKGDLYSGMTINLGLGLPPVTGRSLFAPTDTDIQQEALLEFYRSVIKKEGLSLVVRENIEYFDKILQTVVLE